MLVKGRTSLVAWLGSYIACGSAVEAGFSTFCWPRFTMR